MALAIHVLFLLFEATFMGATADVEVMRADDVPPMRPANYSTYSTAQGCQCASDCGGSLAQGPLPYYQCDWCRVEGSCGQSGYGGHWDYCVYPAMKSFDAQDYDAKIKQVWAALTAPDAVGKSAPAKSAPTVLKDILTESMITTFDNQWEVLPDKRGKVMHVQGVVCQFDLEVLPGTGFTGIFAPGTQKGMIRMGNANSLESHTPQDTPMFPGMGVKFLRSSVRSADFVALRAKGPGGSWNFFANEFANHVAPDPALVSLHKFQQASGCIDMVGLSDVCTYTQTGVKVGEPVFPWEVLFAPAEVNTPDHKKTNAEELLELASIPVGSHMFDVYTFASPNDEKTGTKVLLGKLTTSSQCVQSLFSDTQMFMRHQRMEEDFALRPDWITQVNDSTCVASVGPVSKWQCVAVPKSVPVPKSVAQERMPQQTVVL